MMPITRSRQSAGGKPAGAAEVPTRCPCVCRGVELRPRRPCRRVRRCRVACRDAHAHQDGRQASASPSPSHARYSASASRSRRARLARARAAARARQWREVAAAALQDERLRRTGARCPRGGGHHLQPRDQRGALGIQLAGLAVDRQHHEGDDRVGRLREQPRSDARSGHRTRRCQPREPHLPARRRARDHRRPAAPHAGRLRQRGRAGAGAHLAAWHPGLRATG